MKNSKHFLAVTLLAMVAALLGASAPLHAQSAGTNITIETTHKFKTVWLKGEVIHADSRSMMVREHDNPLYIHTFTYAEGIQGSMEHISNSGGYQYGDKVKIQYMPGQLVALKVRGKPSKPL